VRWRARYLPAHLERISARKRSLTARARKPHATSRRAIPESSRREAMPTFFHPRTTWVALARMDRTAAALLL
jgi:hypothetical protein